MKHDVEEVILDSGTRGLFVHVPDATVTTFSFNFRAGYFTSPKAKWDTPHVLEHLMFNGNEHFPTAQEFNVELEKNGAYANAFTSGWHVAYESECAEFESARIAEIVLQSLTSPLFLPDEFRAEMGNVHEELSGYLNNYFRVLNLEIMKENGLDVFSDSDRIKQLDNIERNDIVSHHQKTHTAENLRFIVGGDMKKHRKELEAIIDTYSAKLPSGTRIDLPAETISSPTGPISVERMDVQKLHYYFDMYLPERRLSVQEGVVNDVLQRLLTGAMSSLIFGEVRRKGLAYGLSSSANNMASSTRWWFGGNVNNTNAEAVMDIIAQEVGNIAQGQIDDDRVEAAKLQAVGSFQRGSQKVSDLVQGYSGLYYFDGTIDDYDAIPDQLQAVKTQDVVDLVQEFVNARSWSFGVLGNITDDETRTLANCFNPLFN